MHYDRDKGLNPRQLLEKRARSFNTSAASILQSAADLETEASRLREQAIEQTSHAHALMAAAERLSDLDPLPPETARPLVEPAGD